MEKASSGETRKADTENLSGRTVEKEGEKDKDIMRGEEEKSNHDGATRDPTEAVSKENIVGDRNCRNSIVSTV